MVSIEENKAIQIFGISRNRVLDFQKSIMLKSWAVFFMIFSMVIFTGEFSTRILSYFIENAGYVNIFSSTLFLMAFVIALAYSITIFKKSEKIINLRYFNYSCNKAGNLRNESIYLLTGFIISQVFLLFITINNKILISNIITYFVYIAFGYILFKALKNSMEIIPNEGYLSLFSYFIALILQIIIYYFITLNYNLSDIILNVSWSLLLIIWIISSILFYIRSRHFRGDFNATQ